MLTLKHFTSVVSAAQLEKKVASSNGLNQASALRRLIHTYMDPLFLFLFFCSAGGYPSNSVQCGSDKYSNKLYIARVDTSEKKKCVGIFNPMQRECVFCHNGKMANSNKYEVLAEKD